DAVVSNRPAANADTSTTAPNGPAVVLAPDSFGKVQVRRAPSTAQRPSPSAAAQQWLSRAPGGRLTERSMGPTAAGQWLRTRSRYVATCPLNAPSARMASGGTAVVTCATSRACQYLR